MEEELREFGLLETEIKVYLATLRLGNASVARISESTGIPRPTIYDNLNNLMNKGLVKTFRKDKKSYYETIDPDVFLDQLKEKEKAIKNILPKLKELSGAFTQKPSVSIYEGKKSTMQLLNEIYKEKELLIYGSAQKSAQVLKHLPENFARKRVEYRIQMKAILEGTKDATFRITDPEIKKITKIKFLDYMKDIPTVTFIFGDKTAVITLEEDIIGIKIDNKSYTDTQKRVFDILWKVAEEK